jgi:glycosyltransferase involved in cell wall biosynthesis
MATELKNLGIESIILGSDPRLIARAAKNNIESFQMRFGADYNPFIINKLYSFFKKRNINHVVVNVGKDVKSAGIAGKLLGINVTIRIGSPGDITFKSENRLLHKFLKPSFLCCSEFTKKNFIKNLPWLTDFTVTAIHPGVTISDHEILLSKKPTIITTSQLNADKRHKDFINACKILVNRNVDFRAKIVGEGQYASSLKKMVHDLELTSHIQFTGYVHDVVRELRSADIFVLPTKCEPLGIALEEAMAQGLLPIARNAGGPPEIWPDFLDTLLPPKSRGEEFADALERLILLPPSQSQKLKRRVRQHALATFSIHKQASRFIDFLKQTSL